MKAWLLFAMGLLFAACESPNIPLPGITGKAGELVVVMPDVHWKGIAGDSVFNTLSQHVYGLPQPEPMFNVVHIRNAAFTKIFQTHRNIVRVQIDESVQPTIALKNDVWAKPQIVVEITAPDEEQFLKLFGANATRIIGHVLKREEERIQKSYRAQLNNEVSAAIEEQWQLKLDVPKGYHLARNEGGFSWIRYETKDVTQSILVYSEPYTAQNTFTAEGMTKVIDAFSKNYVPGPDPGTYMSTYQEYPPMLEETSINERYAARLTGLWHVKGALMGGPFVSYAFLDAAGKRVHYLHGFVFAPGKDKRNLVRQVDAILNSVDLQ